MLNKNINLPTAFRSLVKGLALACVLSAPMVSVLANNALSKTLSKAELLVNITGKVVGKDGKPIPGATVLIKGTKTGVRTDQNGVFRLNMPQGNGTIVVSFVGYKVKEVDITGQQNVTVVLDDSDSALDEVVVTGYGTQKRSEIVGSVATIKGEELQDIPAPNLAAALRNRIAGLGVSEASGRPGARVTLNVRNSTTSAAGQSIGSTSEPLYIIDGISFANSDAFDNLDASMVESITVLKDASAAIYGAAGAKGVILVTTKRGKVGKPSISYNGYAGITDAARKPDMLSAYELGVMLNEGYRMNNEPAARYFSNNDLDYLRGLNVDSWYDQLWQASLTQRHNLSISGGSEKVTFFVGGGYQNENGNYAGTKQDKYTMRSGLQATIVDGLKADVNFNIDNRIRYSKNGLGNDTDQTFFETVLSTPDWIPMEINGLPVNFIRTGTRNPLGVINSGTYDERNSQGYRVNASLAYEPKFLKGLTVKLQVSTGGDANNNTQYTPPYGLYNFVEVGNNKQFFSTELVSNVPEPVVSAASAILQTSLARLNSSQGFLTLSYANTFGKHSLDAVVGGEQTMSYGEGLSSRYINQLIAGSDEYWAFDINTQRTVRTIAESTKRSFFGRMGYDFDKRYLLQIVARLDASSNFATGERWGLSPSVGLGWVVSQEDFFKDNVPFINFLKLKANVGIAGDDRVNSRLWQDRYQIDADNGYLFAGNQYGVGLNPTEYPNPSITWEKKRTVNVGIETALLNNKLNISAEFFQNKIYDGFDQGAPLMNPLYSGIIAPPVNYRESYNWGSEFSIGYNTRIGTDFKIGANMNFGWGNSIVTQMLYPTANFLETDRSDGKWLANQFGTDPRKYSSSNVGYKVLGMFRTQEQVDAFLAENPNYRIGSQVPQPGWLIYEDVNGDGVINTLDQTYLFDRTNPIFSTGVTLNLGYKALSLSTNFVARFGGKVFIDGNSRAAPTTTRNVMAFWRDRWTPDNPMEGTFPRADDPLIGTNSDFWAVNATMIRINNMTLKYAIPANVSKRIGLSNTSVLLTGNNLWTLVNPFTYKDPYTSNAYNYPTVRTISVGLSANL